MQGSPSQQHRGALSSLKLDKSQAAPDNAYIKWNYDFSIQRPGDGGHMRPWVEEGRIQRCPCTLVAKRHTQKQSMQVQNISYLTRLLCSKTGLEDLHARLS